VRRQTLAVAVGVVLSFLAAAAGGYFLYRFSGSLGHQLPMLARYVLNPVIALLVGACVGALAKSRAGVLAALGLVPWALGFLFAQRQDTLHSLVLALLGLLYLLIGAAAATTTFRMRTRSAANGLVRI
jgi:hypothetical protein